MMKKLILLATVFPLIGLAALWAHSDYDSRQGTEWDVPIRGYDPRDLLRGHYVEFRYDWPGLEDDRAFGSSFDRLCIYGASPTIERVVKIAEGEPCDNLVVANIHRVYGDQDLVRGRLYVDQNRARELETRLRDRDLMGIVTVRHKQGGTVTPRAIEFRSLTPQEIADRDADGQDEE